MLWIKNTYTGTWIPTASESKHSKKKNLFGKDLSMRGIELYKQNSGSILKSNYKIDKNKSVEKENIGELTKKPYEIQEKTGIPVVYQRVIQFTADQSNCIIMFRSVGKWCTNLILENYSTKGFHIKGKSCDWGPFAGFVLADGSFSKRPANETEKQQEDHLDAFSNHGAEVTPLIISKERITELVKLKCIKIITEGENEKHVTALKGGIEINDGRETNFILRKIEGADDWRVECKENQYSYIDNYIQKALNGEIILKDEQLQNLLNVKKTISESPNSVFALINPKNSEFKGRAAVEYKNAVTGDLDLFGLGPSVSGGNAYDLGKSEVTDANRKEKWKMHPDIRMQPVDELERAIANREITNIKENKHTGNDTYRKVVIRENLNEHIQKAGYSGGLMVHHSDEADRPFAGDIEYPIFVSVPEKDPLIIEKSSDLILLMNTLGSQYVFPIRKNWLIGRNALSPLIREELIDHVKKLPGSPLNPKNS